jgi:oxygen-dependent protoporphyrinogen oxidase
MTTSDPAASDPAVSDSAVSDPAVSDPDAAASARRGLEAPPTRVVVIGGGAAGLVAARDCARPGFDVTVIEAADVVGGCVGRHEVAGIRLDSGAESFATRGGHVAKLIEELGLADAVVQPNSAGAWLRLPDRTVPLPKGGMLGIPSSPLASDVVRVIGWPGALRAYVDRLMPVLTIGQERSLGVLVRKRMGRAVLDRLVNPVASGVYSAQADDLDLAVVAPGLNAALTRQGSLSGAVGELRGRATKAGSAVGGIAGGMSRLIDALVESLVERGGAIRTGTAVTALERRSAPDASTESPTWQVHLAVGESVEADVVIIAVPAAAALALLRGATRDADPAVDDAPRDHADNADTADSPDNSTDGAVDPADAATPGKLNLADLDWPEASSVELATLVLDAPELDEAPRGTGVLVAEDAESANAAGGMVSAKALTHATAKWNWLAESAGVGRHVLRLSYGRAGRASHTVGLDDAAFEALALRDASSILNMPLAVSSVVGFARTRWTNALPYAALGERDRIQAVRDRVDEIPALEVTGAWLTGTGLAAVIPDAREAAHRVRGLRWKALTENL